MGFYHSVKSDEETLLYTSAELTTAVGYDAQTASSLAIDISNYNKLKIVLMDITTFGSSEEVCNTKTYNIKDNAAVGYMCNALLFAGLVTTYSLSIFGIVQLNSNRSNISSVTLRYSLTDSGSAGGYTGRKLKLKIYGIK